MIQKKSAKASDTYLSANIDCLTIQEINLKLNELNYIGNSQTV